MIGRREFIAGLGSAAWPLAARAQQGERARRLGVISNSFADDPEVIARHVVFLQALQELGWTVGRNLHVDYRWSELDLDRVRRDVDLRRRRPAHRGMRARVSDADGGVRGRIRTRVARDDGHLRSGHHAPRDDRMGGIPAQEHRADSPRRAEPPRQQQ